MAEEKNLVNDYPEMVEKFERDAMTRSTRSLGRAHKEIQIKLSPGYEESPRALGHIE